MKFTGNEVYFSFDTEQNDTHFIFLNSDNFDYGDCRDKDEVKLQAQMNFFELYILLSIEIKTN